MTPTFGEKIKEARKSKNLTQKQLADMIGAAHNSISDWENNKNKPDPDTIELLCGVLKITPNYLLASLEDAFSPQEKTLVKKYRSLDPHGQQTVDIVLNRELVRTNQVKDAQGHIVELEGQMDSRYTPKHLLAYYGRVAAAGKSYGFEDILCGTIEVALTDDNQKADYAIGVSGDSMEPDYTGEDIVYVQKTTHLEKGDIGIFQKDNCIYIKKVGDGELVSINPNYDPIPGADVKVLGRVLGKIDGDYRIIGS